MRHRWFVLLFLVSSSPSMAADWLAERKGEVGMTAWVSGTLIAGSGSRTTLELICDGPDRFSLRYFLPAGQLYVPGGTLAYTFETAANKADIQMKVEDLPVVSVVVGQAAPLIFMLRQGEHLVVSGNDTKDVFGLDGAEDAISSLAASC
jgi:hypothetical protein